MNEPTTVPPGASPYPASREHAPLSGLDEFLVHNAPYPVRVMWTPDAQAYERVWFTSQDKVGDLLVVIGLAFYPNLGTAEAFAIVNHRGLHTTVRAHRKLGNDRMDMAIGPFSFEVVEPFRRWRLRLDADAAEAATGHRIGYDMSWLDTKRPIFRQLGAGIIVGGRAMSPIAGYDGFGRQEGWVETAARASSSLRPPISARATIIGARATAWAGPAATWACSTRTAENGSSSRTSVSGVTTCSTTSATPASAARPCATASTACASNPTPTCSSPERST